MEFQYNAGRIMVILGFFLILINAIDYVFGIGINSPILLILGLIFVSIGMKIKNEKKKK